MTIRYVPYGRYSTDMQNDKSAIDQIAACDEHAKNISDWVKVGEYADEGLTGDAIRKRNELQKLLHDALQGKFDVVMVESVDRLSRRSSEGHYIYEKLEFCDVRIYALLERDFITDMHMAWRMFESSQYLKKLKLNVKRGQRKAIERGGLVGSLPYGYELVRTTAMPRGLRVVNDAQAEIVRRIFAEYASGMSPIEIVRKLNEEGIPSPTGKIWIQSVLFGHATTKRGGILTNEHYRGIYRWGLTERRRNPDTGMLEIRKVDPAQAAEIILPEKLRIIDEVTWNLVQEKIAARRKVPLPRRKLPKHLLSGLLTCGMCGNSYIVSGTSEVACSGRVERGICSNRRRVHRDELENAVLGLLREHLLDSAVVTSYLKSFRAEHKRLLEQVNCEAVALLRKVEKSQQELDRLIAAVATEDDIGSARAVLLMSIEGRSNELERLKEEAEKVQAETGHVRALPPYDAKKILQALQMQLESLARYVSADNPDSARAREVIRDLIDRITIRPAGKEDGRGSGPVQVTIEGRIASLLKHGESSTDRVVQLGLGTITQLNHVTWRATATLENANKAQKMRPPMNLDKVLDYLTSAIEPTSVDELIKFLVRVCGLDSSRNTYSMVKTRVQKCLRHLRAIGIVVSTTVRGSRMELWALKARAHEFWPQGAPSGAENYLYTEKIKIILRKALTPLTVDEVRGQIVSASGQRPSKRRLYQLGCQIRANLHALREQGLVSVVTIAGRKRDGWFLTERAAEILPSGSPTSDGRYVNECPVLSKLSAHDPIIAPDIAKSILEESGEIPTERNIRNALGRVRGRLRQLRGQGSAIEVQISGSRFAGWCLSEEGQKELRSESANSDSGNVEQWPITSILCGEKPIILPEIASRLFEQTESETPDWLIRKQLRRLRARGLAREIRMDGSRFKGWTLTPEGKVLLSNSR